MYCKKCGNSIPDDSVFCPFCGCAIGHEISGSVQTSSKANGEVRTIKSKIGSLNTKTRLIISLILVVASIFCVFQGINKLTSEDYAFYSEHYKECMKGYEECSKEAKYAGYLFRSTYEGLADSYKEMADEDMAKIWGMRVNAAFFVLVAVFLAILAYITFTAKPMTVNELVKKTDTTFLGNNIDLIPETPVDCSEDSSCDTYK